MELVLVWAVCIAAGGIVGGQKGRTGMGVLLGALLGVIGVLIIAILPPDPATKKALDD